MFKHGCCLGASQRNIVVFGKGVCLPSHLKAIIFRRQQYLMCGNISMKNAFRKYGLYSAEMFELEMYNDLDRN